MLILSQVISFVTSSLVIMSSTKSWAQIAPKNTAEKIPARPSKLSRQSSMMNPQPLLYQPLIPALAMLDITCPRCQHKNHPIVLDNLSDGENRPGCSECDVCFPQTGAANTPNASIQAAPARTVVPAQTVDALSVAQHPGDGAGMDISSTEQLLPDRPSTTAEPPIFHLCRRNNFPHHMTTSISLPESTWSYQRVAHNRTWIRQTWIRQISQKSPSSVTWKQKSRAVTTAKLFEGSIPDDGLKDRQGIHGPIGSAASSHTSKQDGSPVVGPVHDWR